VRELANGKRTIEYFLVGPSQACAEQIRALSFASNNTVEYGRQCITKPDAMHCGHIAPYGAVHQFVDLSSSSSSDASESSSESERSSSESAHDHHDDSLAEQSWTSGRDDHCVVKEDWCTKQRQARFLVTFQPGYRGVVVEVPADFVIEVEPVHLLRSDGSTYRCSKACVLELPVPKCGNSRCDSVSSSGEPDLCAQLALQQQHRHVETPRPVVFVPRVEQDAPLALAAAGARLLALGDEPVGGSNNRCPPPSVALATTPPDNVDGSEARAWLNALEEQALALAHCPRAPAPDSRDEFELALGAAATPRQLGNCDLARCRAALLRGTRLTGGVAPHTAAGFVARARALATGAREAYGAERYNEARQAACCAELLFEAVLAQYECPVEHCDALHFYPSNGVFEQAGAEQRRRSLRVDKQTLHAAQQPWLTVAAFEECDAPADDFVPDNDANDAVFAVYATSLVGSLTKRWFASVLHVEARALGTTSDFALELRLTDAHVPAGSRVRVQHHGGAVAAPEECWTANAPAAATADCPSTDVVRLVRSVRSALPHHESSAAPFVNTLADAALAEPAHTVSVYIEVPSAAVVAHALPSLRLALELRDRATDCTVRTAHFDAAHTPHGFAVLAPAPFRWPLEGVPAFINSTELPSGGLCVGGDRARARCNEPDECAGGYCELGVHQCYDAPLPGFNEAALCARPSQCPYGRCYARDGTRSTESGAYPLLAAHLASPAAANAHWFARAADNALLYDADAHRVRHD
jgi:hypothetical protein